VRPARLWRELWVLPIRFYQRFLSPLKPPTCRFHPTCSEYALRAIRDHGALKGVLLGGWRILRCNPFVEGGEDPVPERGRWRSDRER
jgi:putative membrane protein insertion efficiency factor